MEIDTTIDLLGEYKIDNDAAKRQREQLPQVITSAYINQKNDQDTFSVANIQRMLDLNNNVGGKFVIALNQIGSIEDRKVLEDAQRNQDPLLTPQNIPNATFFKFQNAFYKLLQKSHPKYVQQTEIWKYFMSQYALFLLRYANEKDKTKRNEMITALMAGAGDMIINKDILTMELVKIRRAKPSKRIYLIANMIMKTMMDLNTQCAAMVRAGYKIGGKIGKSSNYLLEDPELVQLRQERKEVSNKLLGLTKRGQRTIKSRDKQIEKNLEETKFLRGDALVQTMIDQSLNAEKRTKNIQKAAKHINDKLVHDFVTAMNQKNIETGGKFNGGDLYTVVLFELGKIAPDDVGIIRQNQDKIMKLYNSIEVRTKRHMAKQIAEANAAIQNYETILGRQGQRPPPPPPPASGSGAGPASGSSPAASRPPSISSTTARTLESMQELLPTVAQTGDISAAAAKARGRRATERTKIQTKRTSSQSAKRDQGRP